MKVADYLTKIAFDSDEYLYRRCSEDDFDDSKNKQSLSPISLNFQISVFRESLLKDNLSDLPEPNGRNGIPPRYNMWARVKVGTIRNINTNLICTDIIWEPDPKVSDAHSLIIVKSILDFKKALSSKDAFELQVFEVQSSIAKAMKFFKKSK